MRKPLFSTRSSRGTIGTKPTAQAYLEQTCAIRLSSRRFFDQRELFILLVLVRLLVAFLDLVDGFRPIAKLDAGFSQGSGLWGLGPSPAPGTLGRNLIKLEHARNGPPRPGGLFQDSGAHHSIFRIRNCKKNSAADYPDPHL